MQMFLTLNWDGELQDVSPKNRAVPSDSRLIGFRDRL